MPLGEIHHEVESHLPRMEMLHDDGSQEYKFRLALTDDTPTFVISHYDSEYNDFIKFDGGTTKKLELGTEGAEEVTIGSSGADVTLEGTVALSGSFANSSVNIDGGAVDGTTIGGSNPAAGTFTTLGATGTFSVDPNAVTGGAIVVTNSATQNSAELVKITGTAGQTALNVATGNTDLAGTTTVSTLTDGTASVTAGAFTGTKSFAIDPNAVTGGGIVVSNTATQTSGELVKITGTAGQTALKVGAGNTDLAGTTTVSTLFDGTASLTAGAFTGTKSFAIDPNAAAGGAIVVSNSQTQTSGELVKITGVAGQTALKIVAGETHLQHVSVESITTQSDRRIKENIQEHDLQETHTNVMKLKGVDYNLIADERKSKNTGFVAQEVEEVFPQFVKEDKDGMKSVNYSQMTAVLLSALQHQNSLIEKLTARIEVLESQ